MANPQKKRILFVNESLACAGGEKSLLNLMAALDYDKYDVALQLFKYGCPWDKYIDPRVNVLPQLPYTRFTEMSLAKAVVYSLTHGKLKWLVARVKYSLILRKRKTLYNVAKSCIYWQTQHSCFDNIENKYDYIIAYAQGIPTFYVSDKALGTSKRLAWINVTYIPEEPFKSFIEPVYSKFDVVNAVSEQIKEIEGQHWPSIKDKLTVFRDPINPNTILKLSNEEITIRKNDDILTLVTLGRLTPQKGYEISLDAAETLKQRGIKFIWYILGTGPLENELIQTVNNRGLSDNIIFLGVKDNPYPYLKLADIYVQTSRHEGFGLAIAEARLLNIPVVATRFNTVFMQMVDGKNGLVTDLNGEAVADAIIRLYQDKQLYGDVVKYLRNEPKGNLENLPQFYDILGNR